MGDFYEKRCPTIVVVNLAVKTMRENPLTAVEKNIIAKDIAKGNNPRRCRQKTGAPCEEYSALLGKSRTKKDTE